MTFVFLRHDDVLDAPQVARGRVRHVTCFRHLRFSARLALNRLTDSSRTRPSQTERSSAGFMSGHIVPSQHKQRNSLALKRKIQQHPPPLHLNRLGRRQ